MSPVPARSTTKLQTPAMVTFDAGGRRQPSNASHWAQRLDRQLRAI